MEIKNSKVLFLTQLLIIVYFFCIPFEYFLVSSAGTLLRFIGLFLGIIILFGLSTNRTSNKVFPIFSLILLWLVINALSYFWTSSTLLWSQFLNIYFRNALLLASISLLKFSDDFFKKVLNTYFVSSILLTIYIIYFSYNELSFESRVTLTINNQIFDSNYIVALLAPAFLYSLHLSLKQFSKLSLISLLHFFITILIFFGIISTGSRGGFLAIFFSSFLMILKFALSIFRSRPMLMVVFLSSISILFLLFNQIFSQLGSSLLDRFTLESLTGLVDGGSGRIDIWLASIQGIFTKPFFGFGTGNAIFVNSIYLNKPFGAHNFYLTSLIEIGFFGTTIIFILFSYIFIKLLRLRNFLLFCIFISYAVVLLFLDATSAKFFWSTLTLIQIGISSNNLSNNKSRANKYAY